MVQINLLAGQEWRHRSKEWIQVHGRRGPEGGANWETSTDIHTLDPQVVCGKKSSCQCRRCKRCGFDPWVRKTPWRRKWQLAPVLLPGKFHGQRSLEGFRPWGCKESDTTERLNTHTHTHTLPCIRQLARGKLLCSTGGSVPCSVMN